MTTENQNKELYDVIDDTNRNIRENYQKDLWLDSNWSSILYASVIMILLSCLGIFTISSNIFQSTLEVMIVPIFFFWLVLVFKVNYKEIRRVVKGTFSIHPDIEFERNHFMPLVRALKDFDDSRIKEELAIIDSVIKECGNKSKAMFFAVTAGILVLAKITNVSAPKSFEDGISLITGASQMGIALGIVFTVFYAYAFWLGKGKTLRMNYYASVFRHRLNWRK